VTAVKHITVVFELIIVKKWRASINFKIVVGGF